ncbi:hypothetical protein FXF13_03215 [Vibrio cholerae]|nr:hypothetical protein FXF13_03215 [Vibrio cholerae]
MLTAEAKLLSLHDSMTMANTTDMAKLHALLLYLNERLTLKAQKRLQAKSHSLVKCLQFSPNEHRLRRAEQRWAHLRVVRQYGRYWSPDNTQRWVP